MLMISFKRFMLFIALVIVPLSAYAAVNVTTENSEISEVSPSTGNAIDELKFLRAQLEIRREHQADLLQTVYWALGGVFLLVSLLVGFGWFGNFKVYERDKQSLKEEMHAEAKKKSVELRGELDDAIKEIRDGVDEAISDQVDTRFISIERRISLVESRVLQIELDLAKEKMLSNDSDSMALTDALNLLNKCYISAENEIPDVLKFIVKKLDEGGKFTAKEHARITEILDDLPARYTSLVGRVHKRMNDSEIF